MNSIEKVLLNLGIVGAKVLPKCLQDSPLLGGLTQLQASWPLSQGGCWGTSSPHTFNAELWTAHAGESLGSTMLEKG